MSNTSLTLFKEQELYPALFSRINVAFPEMEFQFRNGYWQSPYHIDGKPSSSKDQTFVHHKRKDLIKDNSGNAMSLIDFEMKRSNCTFYKAITRLAEVCGLKLPDEDESRAEFYKKYDDSRLRLEKLEKLFQDELWSGSDDGNKVLDYLRNRGWKDDEIKFAGLGCANEDAITSLYSTTNDKYELGGPKIGKLYKLAIPFRRGNWISGFKFRLIEDVSDLPKYLNSRGVEKNLGVFGEQLSGFEPYQDFKMKQHKNISLTDAKYNKNKFASSIITVVMEGELDALHAASALRNLQSYQIVATAGGAMSGLQVSDALVRGYRKFVLFFDNDRKGMEFTKTSEYNIHTVKQKILSRQNLYTNIELDNKVIGDLLGEKKMPKDSIYLANMEFDRANEIKIFVAQFPAGVKDADEFLRTHTPSELFKLIQCAEPYDIWNAGCIIDEFTEDYFQSYDYNFPEYPYVIRLNLYDRLKNEVLDFLYHEEDREKVYAKLRNDYLPADIEPFVRELYKSQTAK